MAIKINKQDKFFGLALYTYFRYNSNVRPTMLQTQDNDLSCYEMLGATGDTFYLFIKFRSKLNTKLLDGSLVWALKFTDRDKAKIEECAGTGSNVYILYVCCNESIEDANFLIFTYKEYLEIKDKPITTVKLVFSDKRYENKFSVLKDRDVIFKIDRNRIEKNLLELDDVI